MSPGAAWHYQISPSNFIQNNSLTPSSWFYVVSSICSFVKKTNLSCAYEHKACAVWVWWYWHWGVKETLYNGLVPTGCTSSLGTWARPLHLMTSPPCWGWTWAMATQTCTLSGECVLAVRHSSSFFHRKAEVSHYPLSSHINAAHSITNEPPVLGFECFPLPTPTIHLLTHHYIPRAPLHICVCCWPSCLAVCHLFLQGCRKWTLWLTKGWKMSSSQTSGVRSAWRDSAPLVMCWSVMALIINTYARTQWNAKQLGFCGITWSLMSLCFLPLFPPFLFPEQRTGW